MIESTLEKENKRRQNEEKMLNDKVENQMKALTLKEDESSGDLKKIFDVG